MNLEDYLAKLDVNNIEVSLVFSDLFIDEE